MLKKQLNYDEQYDKKQTLLTFKLEAVVSDHVGVGHIVWESQNVRGKRQQISD